MTTSPDDIRKEALDPNERYRVRDGKGEGDKPVIVWGENLTWDEAHALKESVVGAEKSRTARLEPMSVPSLVTAASPPDPDPYLELVRSKALAAAHGEAMAAQARADAAQTAAKPIDLSVEPSIEEIVNIPDIDLEDAADAADIPDDISAAQADVDAQFAEYDAKGAELYEAHVAKHGQATEQWRPWSELNETEKGAFRFEAANTRRADGSSSGA